MATNYPTSLDTSTQQPSPSATTEMDDSGYEHDVVHTNASGAIIALETKLGVGSTTAAGASTNQVLVKQADGDTEWAAAPSTTPTDITVADTTDTSCSVALFESATGDLAPKTDGGLTYNAGTGTLTATAFSGPLTGNVTGNASGTAATVTGAAQTAITSVGALTGLTVGSDGNGGDVTFHSDTAGDAMVWDSSAESLTITGTDGQTALAVADGNVTITDKLTVSGGLEAPLGVENKTGNYTMVLADAGKCITMNSGSNYTLTIPANSSVAYPVGTTLTFVRLGSGTVTIAITSDTLSSKDGNKKIAGQYASATAIKTASTTWVLIGSLEA
ncbi:MAG: hypothetical protein CL440_06875 [Acidimicrobiaceae bacterium]|nr:hypothetical protein [Acidimicrobiaceae bacterium]|tara:strand:- start:3424 stop:4416 length:993 start_codon:yes stop_codon:yes gene_type:complete